MIGILEIFSIFVTITAVTCFGISAGTTYWYSIGQLNYGLFFACNEFTCIDLGWDISDGRDLFLAKICVIVIAVCAVIGLLLQSYSLRSTYDYKKKNLSRSTVLFILAFLFSIAAPSLVLGFDSIEDFASSTFNNLGNGNLPLFEGREFGYSFYLMWVTAGLFLFGSILICVTTGSVTPELQIAPQQTTEQIRKTTVVSVHQSLPQTSYYY